jgi:hypothetical protein
MSLIPQWQARRDSNPQPAVLETAALPVELLASNTSANDQDAGYPEIAGILIFK